MTFREFSLERVGALLDRLAAEVERAAQSRNDPVAIHELRVSIRRFAQALRALGATFSKKDRNAVRERLREMMDLAAELRGRDVALELFEAAGIEAKAPPCARLRKERERFRRQLSAKARQWRREGMASWFRERLGLPAPGAKQGGS
jgi:CHAD domain-containing protein